jgi:hypothetical protein
VKLAVFFPASLFSAWCCSYGLVNTLKRMGHEVVSCPVDTSKAANKFDISGDAVDAIIISGPEHIKPEFPSGIDELVPRVAWMHETVEREDYGKLDVDAIKGSADIVFCPGIQDEKYGFRYLPFGVDTEIFKPRQCGAPPKTIDAAFIGLLYPKRQAFLKELRAQGVDLVTGNVQVLEIDGVNPRKTAELYAENIRKIKVFVNLPTLSQLAVTKIYEVLACGTPVLTPKIEHMKNLEGLPVETYSTAAECAAIVITHKKGFQPNPSEFTMSAIRSDFIHNHHRLELRCQTMIEALKEIGAKAA